ncbi:uncharacterized protein LOC131155610 isoform X1 [Malania oleifera]|uniref:uncharacterized protein LOC131155610 isoform X1 n=1 Tax=Malania oleifera TaxID=397392 RepID=UPI0025AE09D1|nr:uncharacterized protein LOC131155610 isoform X1 [Malania oleifera]
MDEAEAHTASTMAETNPQTAQISNPSEVDDPDIYRTTKPGLKRLVLTLSVAFSFLLGSPFLLKSIEIYRSPLPFHDIDSLSKQIESKPILFPCHFQAVFLGFDNERSDNLVADKLGSAIRDEMTKLTLRNPPCGSCRENFTLSVTVDSGFDCVRRQIGGKSCPWRCGAISAVDFDENDDERVDELLNDALGSCAGRVYSVVVVNKGEQEIRAVVGKHRHGWIVGSVLEPVAMVSRVAETFVKVFVYGGREEEVMHGEFMPVGADGRVVLSFNLLNADPNDWTYDWDFQRVDEILLAPIIEALGAVANISVESQVLYHTPRSSFSYWDNERNSYIFSTKDLPFFMNSNEWHLDTSIAAGGRSKILQVVVYIPSAKECPLLLQLPSGEISITNAFISPMWGGIIVWNPPGCLRDLESNFPTMHRFSHQELQRVFEVSMGQLRQLFGLKSDNLYVGASGTAKLLASERGFAEWELDLLARHHTCFNLISCSTTLGSLSRLVQSLPRMIIMDEIGRQVKFSLLAAKLAQSNASLGIYDASAVSSRLARSLAEDAFSHPSVMSVSYYSFEHCFAVYSPFFLPVLLHVLLATVREWRRYKKERTKYFRWKTKKKAA